MILYFIVQYIPTGAVFCLYWVNAEKEESFRSMMDDGPSILKCLFIKREREREREKRYAPVERGITLIIHFNA